MGDNETGPEADKLVYYIYTAGWSDEYFLDSWAPGDSLMKPHQSNQYKTKECAAWKLIEFNLEMIS